jgi:hypothetical protein
MQSCPALKSSTPQTYTLSFAGTCNTSFEEETPGTDSLNLIEGAAPLMPTISLKAELES